MRFSQPAPPRPRGSGERFPVAGVCGYFSDRENPFMLSSTRPRCLRSVRRLPPSREVILANTPMCGMMGLVKANTIRHRKPTVTGSVVAMKPRFWKLSQGDYSEFLARDMLESIEDHLVYVHGKTKALAGCTTTQGQEFIKAPIGDYFYL